MSNDNGKISVRQAMILFIIIFCAPAIRYIPLYTAQQAKQAAWLSPLITFIFMLIYILIFSGVIKKYEQKSFVDITKDILGKIVGNIVVIMYFLWITLLLSYNLRMYVERIASAAMPNVSVFVSLTAMLIIVGFVVKFGIIPLAKMGELFFIGLAAIFILYNFLILPEIHIKNLLPISYTDAFPVFQASFGILAIFSYNILIFMFNDKIEHKGEFKKLGIKTVVVITLISLLVIIIPLGVFGDAVLVKMPIPYLNTMMQISLFDIIERVEAGIIMFWIVTDFMLISIFIYSAIHMLRLSFNLSNIKPLTTIYIVGIFYLSLALAKSTLELRTLSEYVITPMNIVMGFILPILIFGVGKLRKKV